MESDIDVIRRIKINEQLEKQRLLGLEKKLTLQFLRVYNSMGKQVEDAKKLCHWKVPEAKLTQSK